MNELNGIFAISQKCNRESMLSMVGEMTELNMCDKGNEKNMYFSDSFMLCGKNFNQELENPNSLLYNEDRTVVVLFNGRIYNIKNIRQNLIHNGHTFATQNDAEVVVHLFEEYGKECIKYIDGTYAFCIYDIKADEVFIFRDRIGEKNIYYYKDDDVFLFSSELRNLLNLSMIHKEINAHAMYSYFQLTYIPSPLTIFENIYKVPAGSYIHIKNNIIDMQEYWDIKYDPNNLISDYNECKRLLRKTLFESVEMRMEKNEVNGAFLSGGIDSTTIVGIMSQISERPIETFTIGYKVKQYDESDRAYISSMFHKTNHHLHMLDYDDALAELDNIIGNMDEPFADTSAIPTYMVSKYAKNYVNTVLTGDAGDEIFAGYSKYLIGYFSNKYNKIPRFVRKYIFEKIILSIPDRNKFTRQIRKVINNADKDCFSRRKNLMQLGFKDDEMPLLFQKDEGFNYTSNLIKGYYEKYTDFLDETSRTLYTDFKVVLEGDMLPKVANNSKLVSLEARAPLLSRDVIELASRIPIEYKINARNQKIILKDTFKDLIPKELNNAPKSGFSVPIDYWFNNELKDELTSVLDKDVIEKQGILKNEYVDRIMREHFTGERNRKSELWALYVFQKWYKKYF